MQNAQTLVLETIKGLIEENEIKQAFDMLKDLDKQSDANIWQDLALQYSNYRSALKAFGQHQITYEEFMRYETKTKFALIELMQDIPRKVLVNAKIHSERAYQYDVPDNIRLEKLLGSRSNSAKVDWLEKARKAAIAVCRIVCGEEYGTGFLAEGGYVFTSNHVIRSAEDAKNARLAFNYGLGKAIISYTLDVSDFHCSPPDIYDFARVKVLDRSDEPLSQWGFVEFDAKTIPQVGEGVTVIQNPMGEVKQFKSDEVLGHLNQYLFYTTQTEPGSSGSPVLNKDCKVVAIHHAGKMMSEGGFVINDKGDRAGANRGILFQKIFAFIGK